MYLLELPNMRYPLTAVFIALLGGTPLLSAAETLNLSSGEQATPVLELFTSQGCSSCPPAEQWLSTLTRAPQLWSGVIPLAFHVDYWDALGWADAFANPSYSARQRAYEQSGGSRSVYTPAFMVAGNEWRGWFGGEQLRLPSTPKVGKLNVQLTGNQVHLNFAPAANIPAGLTAHVARLGFGLQSKVTRGENAGKTLQHDFVVLTLQQVSASSSNQWHTQLPADPRGERQALVAWLSVPGDPAPYQAVAGWLTNFAAHPR
jgi:hypothetical protein